MQLGKNSKENKDKDRDKDKGDKKKKGDIKENDCDLSERRLNQR